MEGVGQVKYFYSGLKSIWTECLLPILAFGAYVATIVSAFWLPFFYIRWMVDNHWGLLTLIPVVLAIIWFVGWFTQDGIPSEASEVPIDKVYDKIKYDPADHDRYYRGF